MERVSDLFSGFIKGEKAGRLPAVEWAPWWNLTADRWYNEGSKIKVNNTKDILALQRYFGLDGCIQSFFQVRSGKTPVAPSFGAGIIRTEEDYERIKPTLYRDPAELFPADYYEWLGKTHKEGDVLHFFSVEGFFWMPRELFGVEEHLFSFYDKPDFLHRICEDYLNWLKKVIEFIGNTFTFDFMSFAEDMSYNNGPMLSKETFDEFLAPYYLKIIPLIKQLGVPVFVDSDGDITLAVDWYAGVGADGMFPLERRAGVDVSVYIDKQPDMAYLGHFDKTCMEYGEKAMREEFERLLPSARRGKLLFSVDHQTPPNVSIDNYRIYVSLLKEYAKKACE